MSDWYALYVPIRLMVHEPPASSDPHEINVSRQLSCAMQLMMHGNESHVTGPWYAAVRFNTVTAGVGLAVGNDEGLPVVVGDAEGIALGSTAAQHGHRVYVRGHGGSEAVCHQTWNWS